MPSPGGDDKPDNEKPYSRMEATDAILPKAGAVEDVHTLVVALLGALVAGFIYAYSTYSNALQHAFNLSEQDKELIGLASSLCNLLTVTNGLIIDRTSITTGLVLGGLLMMGSYG